MNVISPNATIAQGTVIGVAVGAGHVIPRADLAALGLSELSISKHIGIAAGDVSIFVATKAVPALSVYNALPHYTSRIVYQLPGDLAAQAAALSGAIDAGAELTAEIADAAKSIGETISGGLETASWFVRWAPYLIVGAGVIGLSLVILAAYKA